MRINNITVHEHNNRPGDSTSKWVAIYHNSEHIDTRPRKQLETYFRINYFERGVYDVYPRKSPERKATFTEKRYGNRVELIIHYYNAYKVDVYYNAQDKISTIVFHDIVPAKIEKKIYRKLLTYTRGRYKWIAESEDIDE